jgi:fermentation-respiration switch protein FrsA (DUF1100 family)
MGPFQKLFSSPAAVLKLTIALCYLALGVYLYLNDNLLYFVDKGWRILLVAVFIGYGAFRLYRAINDVNKDE